jgi:uncharacterized integral membrane protein
MRFAFILILMVLAVALAAQNADVATINVFWWELRASIALIVVVCFVFGALVTGLVLAPQLYRRRASERALRARIATLEAGEPIGARPRAAEDALATPVVHPL